MIHVTIFGGHEGRLQGDKRFYLTLFGACELVRPTIARQLLAKRQMEQDQAGYDQRTVSSKVAERGQRPAPHKPFFLTMFGALEIKSPTLAEEFIDLREMTSSGLLSMEDWNRSMAELGRTDAAVASFTMFGGFDECALPSEDEEVDSLAVQRHLGNIPESAGQVLQYGIGQHGEERTATVQRAILTPA